MSKFDRNRIKHGWEKLCANKQTDRHYENNGHLAVNQFINAHSGQQKPNLRRKKEGVNWIGRPAGVLRTWDDDEKCRGAGTNLKSWREWVPNFRSCNAEAAGAKWSTNNRTESRLVFDKLREWVGRWAGKAQRNGESRKWCCVCCSLCGPCRAVSDHLHLLTKLPKTGVRVRRVRTSQLLLQSIRRTSRSGSRLARSVHRHRPVLAGTLSRRSRRQTSNANCRNGWVRRQAAKLLQRRNWKIVHFSRDGDFRSRQRCFNTLFSTVVLSVQLNAIKQTVIAGSWKRLVGNVWLMSVIGLILLSWKWFCTRFNCCLCAMH